MHKAMCASRMYVVILLVVIITGINTCSEEDFQVTEDTGAILEYVRYGHYIELKCCSRDTSVQVTWYKWENETNTWETLDSSSSDYQFHHHRHVMSINSASFDDEGFYKCSTGLSGTSIQSERQFEVQVISCDSLARGPFPIAPLPCSKTDAEIGTTLTLPCTGYFGCGDKSDLRLVTWFVSPLDKIDMWKPVSELNEERYVTTTFTREGYSIYGSNLTIHRVQPVDFSRKYMCVLASPQVIDGQTQLVVELQKEDDVSLRAANISPQTFVILVTMLSMISIFTLVIAGLFVYKCMVRKRSNSNITLILRSPIYSPVKKNRKIEEFGV